MDLSIEIEGDRESFRPGERIRGRASWKGLDPGETVELRLFCFCRGAGDHSVEIFASESWPAASSGASFDLEAPSSVHSTLGVSTSVGWAIELVVPSSGACRRVHLDITRDGAPPQVHETIAGGRASEQRRRTNLRAALFVSGLVLGVPGAIGVVATGMHGIGSWFLCATGGLMLSVAGMMRKRPEPARAAPTEPTRSISEPATRASRDRTINRFRQASYAAIILGLGLLVAGSIEGRIAGGLMLLIGGLTLLALRNETEMAAPRRRSRSTWVPDETSSQQDASTWIDPKGSRLGRLVGTALISAPGLFLLALVAHDARSDPDNLARLAICIGLALAVGGFVGYRVLSVLSPRPRVRVSPQPLRLGEPFTIHWSVSAPDRFRSLRLELVGEETVVWNDGDGLRSSTKRFYRESIGGTDESFDAGSGSPTTGFGAIEAVLPAGVPHTVRADRESIDWSIQASGKGYLGTRLRETYPIDVLPAANMDSGAV